MNRIKSFCLALIAANAALLSTIDSQAQTYGATTITVPATIAVSITTNSGQVIDMRYNRNLPIFISAGASNAACTVTVNLLRSLDGVNYETTAGLAPLLNVPAAATAANGATNINFDIGGVGFVKVQNVVISSGGGVSNVIVQVGLKPPPN